LDDIGGGAWEPPVERGGIEILPDGSPYIVVVGRWYYLRYPNGQWSPPTTGELVVDQGARLYPREDWQVPTRTGTRPMKVSEAVRIRGRLADAVRYTYLQPRYDWDSNTLYIGIGRQVEVPPAHNERCAEFLSMVGDDKLLDWLATYQDLTRPTSLLALTGPTGAGKSTLLRAIAARWGGWADMSLILGNFQDALMLSPIVGADEGLPTRNDAASRKLREIVTATSVSLNPKGKPAGRIEGAVRLVALANGPDPLKLGAEAMFDDDTEAIASRILHFHLPGTLGQTGFMGTHGAEVYRALPGHVAWLGANRRPETGSRLLVEGDGRRLIASAQASTKAAREVYGAILADTEEPDRGSWRPVQIDGDDLLVSVRKLLAAGTFARRPSEEEARKALKAIGATEHRTATGRFWRVAAAAVAGAL